ncbi:MAG: GC-type dockerin domain-anchored protein [Phycisphaerales bacterium]|nr:GC-type dockerin domain-anchored protein [Phycisphaerales bacterium]
MLRVDQDAPPGGLGLSWDTALQNLEDALLLRRQFNLLSLEIRIAEGSYTPTDNPLDREASFELGFATEYPPVSSAFTLTIRGGYAGLGHADPDEHDPDRFVTILSGDLNGDDAPGFVNREDNSHHVVTVRDTIGQLMYLEDLVIEGGNAVGAQDDRGGGIYVRPGLSEGKLRLSNCLVRDNVAEHGGGIYADTQSEPYYRPNVFTLSSAMVLNNLALGSGGGIYANFLTAQFVKVVQNEAREGGGIAVFPPDGSGGTLRVETALIAANSATERGGGGFGGGMSLTRATIVHNSGAEGSAWFVDGNCSMRLAIVGPQFSAARAIEVGSGVCTLSVCCVDGGEDQIGPASGWNGTSTFADPRFRDPLGPDGDALTWEDNDYRLLFDSPCIDRYYCDVFQSSDLNANPPCVYANIASCHDSYRLRDIGAYEYQPPACPGDFDGDGVLSSADLLTYLNAYSAQRTQADLAQPCTSWTSDDFMASMMLYAAGC